jgi:hypothetical protein
MDTGASSEAAGSASTAPQEHDPASLEPVSSTAGKKTSPFVAAAVDDTDRKSTAHEHTSTGHEHSSGEEEDREHSPIPAR